jgi:hypothetical protein
MTSSLVGLLPAPRPSISSLLGLAFHMCSAEARAVFCPSEFSSISNDHLSQLICVPVPRYWSGVDCSLSDATSQLRSHMFPATIICAALSSMAACIWCWTVRHLVLRLERIVLDERCRYGCGNVVVLKRHGRIRCFVNVCKCTSRL